ncbi:unnamed protein product [Rotaria magnacalcarata]|uniref:RNA helicase n=1 Tax=Rotaria magnacalcarata TaxID=392030 RepID=A0A816VP21_9BILA|nr:unnamed protein product [Rotaria magnacalcarata]
MSKGKNDTNQNSNTDTSFMELDGLIQSNWTEVVEQFEKMDLLEKLLRGIYSYDFEQPTALQQRATKLCILR